MDTQKNLMVPMSIVIAGLLIAGAVLWTNSEKKDVDVQKNTNAEEGIGNETAGSVKPIDEDDYFLGNPNADVVVVTYTDVECPYCKRFHETVLDIMENEDYAKDGKVAWVLRNYPIPQLHPLAIQKMSALECVGKLGGDDAYWNFANKIFDEIKIDGSMELERFSEVAFEQGFDEEEFNNCLESNETNNAVKEDFDSANASGARGTPFSVVISGNKKEIINGAQNYDYVDSKIRSMLK